MTSSSSVSLLDLAAAALSSVILAADQIKEMAQDNQLNARRKADGTFVTDADFAAQSIIEEALRKISTGMRIVGEENEEEVKRRRIEQDKERNQRMFQLAQEEIFIRYHGTAADKPLPLAQSDSSSTIPNTTSAIKYPSIQDYQVNPSRVSVFVDPLDGTKAYAQGEYETVSILAGIVLDHKPCFGVICKPFGYKGHPSVLDTGCVAFYGGTLLGATFTAGGESLMREAQSPSSPPPRAVISSSKAKGVVEDFVAHLGSMNMIHPEPLMVSGAGEKSLRIILRTKQEGLWFYPKAGTSLWDVAASDAMLRIMGGKLTDKHGTELDYSRSHKEATNRNGIVACYDGTLHEKCIQLFQAGSWSEAAEEEST